MDGFRITNIGELTQVSSEAIPYLYLALSFGYGPFEIDVEDIDLEPRDDDGFCKTCEYGGCCEHAPCGACLRCVGMNSGDFL